MVDAKFPEPPPLPKISTVESLEGWYSDAFPDHEPGSTPAKLNLLFHGNLGVRRLSDRVAIEANLAKVREALKRAEAAEVARRASSSDDEAEAANELGRWNELIEDFKSAERVLGDALKPERDARPCCLRLTRERRAAFLPMFRAFYEFLPSTKAIASVMEIAKEAANFPKPLPAGVMWSMAERRKQEEAERRAEPDEEKRVLEPLKSLFPVADPKTMEEVQRTEWLNGDYAPDRFVEGACARPQAQADSRPCRFDEQPDDVKKPFQEMAKRNFEAYNGARYRALRNQPFKFPVYEGCFGPLHEAYAAKRKKFYKPSGYADWTDDMMEAMLAAQPGDKRLPSTGIVAIDILPRWNVEAFYFQVRRLVSDVNERVKQRNEEVLTKAAAVAAATSANTATTVRLRSRGPEFRV